MNHEPDAANASDRTIQSDLSIQSDLTIRMEIDGEEIEFYPLEQVRLSGVDYLLVSDTADGDGEALILRDLSEPDSSEALYEIVEDDAVLEAVGKIFAEELDEEGIELQ